MACLPLNSAHLIRMNIKYSEKQISARAYGARIFVILICYIFLALPLPVPLRNIPPDVFLHIAKYLVLAARLTFPSRD